VEVVIIQRKIYDKLLNIRRVAISVNEIIGYDSKEDAFRFIPLFYWNSVQDEFTYRGHGNSYLLNTKIAPSRGLAHSDYRVIYDELDKRAKLLQAMVDFGNFDYNNVWNAVQKIEDVGIENISNPTQFIKDFIGENKGGK
jgi:flagellar protein FlaI